MARHLLFFLCLGHYAASITALVGYDCSVPNLKITTYANTDVAPCKPPVVQTQDRQLVTVQITQRLTHVQLPALHCKLVYTQQMTHCGMHSHSSQMPDGLTYHTYTFTPQECQLLIDRNRMEYPFKKDEMIRNLKPNHINRGTVVVAGYIAKDGYCEGAEFDSHTDVLVIHTYSIVYSAPIAEYEVDRNLVHFGNIRCPMTPTTCHDTEYGDYFWSLQKYSPCDFSYYHVLYQGNATLVSLKDKTTDLQYKVLTVRHQAYLYSLLITGKTTPCMHELSTTDQPNIFTSFNHNLFPNLPSRANDSSYVNPFAFFNTKIYYVANHIAEQLENLYRDILFHTCQLKRITLFNLLTLGLTAPRHFAYALTQRPGYTAYLAGELLHLIACAPVNVTYRTSERCYQEVPVYYKNEEAFLTPRNHLLVYHAHEVDCVNLFPIAYNFSNQWQITTRQPTLYKTPDLLDPNIEATWSFSRDYTLSTAGIYSHEQIESYSRTLRYSYERDAVASVLLNTLYDSNTHRQNINFANLIDAETLKQSIRSTFADFISRMTSFGIFVSTAIGIITLIKVCVTILEIFINMTSLYRVYGFSYHLCCAIFHSATSALLYVFKHSPQDKYPPAYSFSSPHPTDELLTPTRMPNIYPELPPKPSTSNPVYTQTLHFTGPLKNENEPLHHV